MNDTQTQPTLLVTDGPATCIWKVMEGRGWLTTPQIMDLLREAGCQYATTTLRNKLFALARGSLESQEILPKTSYGCFKNYRTPPGKSMPLDLDKKSRKAPAAVSLAEELKATRRRETMDVAVEHMSAMMMAFVKRK